MIKALFQRFARVVYFVFIFSTKPASAASSFSLFFFGGKRWVAVTGFFFVSNPPLQHPHNSENVVKNATKKNICLRNLLRTPLLANQPLKPKKQKNKALSPSLSVSIFDVSVCACVRHFISSHFFLALRFLLISFLFSLSPLRFRIALYIFTCRSSFFFSLSHGIHLPFPGGVRCFLFSFFLFNFFPPPLSGRAHLPAGRERGVFKRRAIDSLFCLGLWGGLARLCPWHPVSTWLVSKCIPPYRSVCVFFICFVLFVSFFRLFRALYSFRRSHGGELFSLPCVMFLLLASRRLFCLFLFFLLSAIFFSLLPLGEQKGRKKEKKLQRGRSRRRNEQKENVLRDAFAYCFWGGAL